MKTLKLIGLTIVMIIAFILLMTLIAFIVIYIDKHNLGVYLFIGIGSILLIRGAYSIANYIINHDD